MMQKLSQYLLRTLFHYQPTENWMNCELQGLCAIWHNVDALYVCQGDAQPIFSWLVLVCGVAYGMIGHEINSSSSDPNGSSTIGTDGAPFIIYTGKMNTEQGHTSRPHRPTSQKEADGNWVFRVGSVIRETNTTRVAYLFKSKHWKHWELVDNRLYTLPGSGIWECIDFYRPDPSSQNYVLKASLFNTQHDIYALGSYDSAAHKFIPDNPELDFFGFESSRYDYGRVYANDSFFEPVKQRHIVLSWVNETDTEELELQRGWSGFLTIPQTVAVDSKTGVNFINWPIDEVESLRISEQLDMEVFFDYPDVSIDGVVTDEADSMNEQFNCNQGGSAHRGVFGPFGLLVLTDENFKEQTAVFFYISHSGNGQWITRVCNDETRASLLPGVDFHVYGNPVHMLPTEDFLSLCILWKALHGGSLVVTSRVYPTVAIGDLAKLYLFNNGMTPITVRNITTWHMSQVIMTPY
ncbi:unnamed protein product [Sphagnum tenellum]